LKHETAEKGIKQLKTAKNGSMRL